MKMRLFIAITLDESSKDILCKKISEMKKKSSYGVFTHRDNLHLTLVFLGEVNRIELPKIKVSMNKITALPFDLKISGLGRFKRSGGDIWWAGIADNDVLSEIFAGLITDLSAYRYNLESCEFKPHLTLGRQVVLNTAVTPMASFDIRVSSIDLMKSERINGVLTYTKIFTKKLEGELV